MERGAGRRARGRRGRPRGGTVRGCRGAARQRALGSAERRDVPAASGGPAGDRQAWWRGAAPGGALPGRPYRGAGAARRTGRRDRPAAAAVELRVPARARRPRRGGLPGRGAGRWRGLGGTLRHRRLLRAHPALGGGAPAARGRDRPRGRRPGAPVHGPAGDRRARRASGAPEATGRSGIPTTSRSRSPTAEPPNGRSRTPPRNWPTWG
jgi:hypothetical protein